MNQKRPKRLRQTAWQKDSVYADLSHPEWLAQVPSGFWDDFNNHKRYMKWLFNRLELSSIDQWHDVSHRTVSSNYGIVLLQKHGGYLNLLRAVYPTHEWHPWRLNKTPAGFRPVDANQREYLKWLGKQIGFKKPRNWYQLRRPHLLENHGCSLLALKHNDFQEIAKVRYPNFDFKHWMFSEVCNHFWDRRPNRLSYLSWLEKKCRIKKPSDWYKHTVKTLEKNFEAKTLTTRRNTE